MRSQKNYIWLKDQKYAKALKELIRAQGHNVNIDFSVNQPVTEEGTSWDLAIGEIGAYGLIEKRPSFFKKGKWYKKIATGNCLVKTSNPIDLNTAKGYGFMVDGTWEDNMLVNTEAEWIEATHAEVAHMLKKRVIYNYSDQELNKLDPVRVSDPWDFTYCHVNDALYTRGRGRGGEEIYSRGKWAKVEVEPTIKVKGFEVRFEDEELIVGCTRVPAKVDITTVCHLIMEMFGHDFSPSDVQKILEFYCDRMDSYKQNKSS